MNSVTYPVPRIGIQSGEAAESQSQLPFLQRIRRARRHALLLNELEDAGMPNAAAEVKAGNWSGILDWITTNLPTILGLITALISLLTGA